MAQKKITDLQLISSLTDSVNIPGDNGIQTYRATMAQFFTYIRGKIGGGQTLITTTGTTLTTSSSVVEFDASGGDFTQALPAVASFPTGFTFYFKNNETTGVVTLDGNSSEVVEDAVTFKLAPKQAVICRNTGSKWQFLASHLPISSLIVDSTPDFSADYLKTYDASASVEKKVLISSVRNLNVVSKTTTYTATILDDLILCSGSSFTITLPSAASAANKVLTIKKTDTSFTNLITIDGSGSETIDGNLTRKLYSKNESIVIVSDGSNWQILQRTIPMETNSFTPTVSAGFGTVSNNTAYATRDNTFLEVIGFFTCGTTAGSEGTVVLPHSLNVSTASIRNNTNAQPGPIVGNYNTAGYNGSLGNLMTSVSTDPTKVYWAGHVGVAGKDVPTASVVTEIAGSSVSMAYRFRVPISEFESA